MTKHTILVEIEIDAPDVTPMYLDQELSEVVNYVKQDIMDNQYQHDGIINVGWDDPKPAKLTITITEVDHAKT